MNYLEAENIKKKYQYRWLILQGKIKLPYKTASRLIGPDCAYHLYTHLDNKTHREKK